MDNTLAAHYLKELNSEYKATHACLERIPAELFGYKPHPKSMTMGYLAQLVAEIPLWITFMIREGEIDFAGFKHGNPKTTNELIDYFEENIAWARKELEAASDRDLDALFSLKSNGQVLYSAKKIVDIGVTLNHWVHHRGQLTVYLRLNDIAVPSLYGPSADEKNFTPPE